MFGLILKTAPGFGTDGLLRWHFGLTYLRSPEEVGGKCYSTTLARAVTGIVCLGLCYWGVGERWQCRDRTMGQPTADFSFESLCAPFE